jgi:signal transduction histidine kinase/HAMP domain-containing protein
MMSPFWRGRSLFAIVSRSLLVNGLAVSLLFLVAIVSFYQMRLREQRTEAAMRINLLLQVSLENAMLKRDLPGLTEIVERLGQQRGIDSVMILNSQGEVRIASRPALVGRRFDPGGDELCPGCAWDGKTPLEQGNMLPRGMASDTAVLRSVKVVANREACVQCHGQVSENPVNGLLVVDHDAGDLRRSALMSTLALAGSGLVVVLGLIAGAYVTLRRTVLQPVAQLEKASRMMAGGDLSAKAHVEGVDELAALGRSFNDMAARLKVSMDEVQGRERLAQALIETLPDGVRVIDQDHTIRMTNEAYRRMHGRCGEAGNGISCYSSSHRRSEPCVQTLVNCPLVALDQPEKRLKFHAIHKRADGGDMSVEINAARLPLETLDGPRMAVVEVIRDLDAAGQVSHEQRLSELGQLATGVAHEIRNPLSSIALLLQDAQASLGEGRPFDQAATFRIIDHEVGRCLATTESLLKLGTPPAAEPQLILLNEVVADILRLLASEAGSAWVQVTSRMEEHLRVLASDNDIRIMVINLVQNAFHAMPNGGRLTITGERTPGGKIALAFADSGIGIAPEDLRAIFLPFWSRRADGVRGTGLGLSICRTIVRALGGDIRVSSEQGRGSTFTILLPDADHDARGEHVH